MRTRGLFGFVADGQVRVAYSHSDSYPEYLGEKMLAFAAQLVKDGPEALASAKARVLELKVVDDQASTPSAEDISALQEWSNTRVGSLAPDGRPTWYQLLRRTQGDPDAVLSSGYIIDARDFGNDSLHCEWAYLINFDAERVEVYRGFRESPPVAGFWRVVELDGKEAALRAARGISTYYPINLACVFPFTGLPVPEEFTRQIYGGATSESPVDRVV